MNEVENPIGAALGSRFSRENHRAVFCDSERVRNQRRNLNLDMIALMERGHGAHSPQVRALRERLAQINGGRA